MADISIVYMIYLTLHVYISIVYVYIQYKMYIHQLSKTEELKSYELESQKSVLDFNPDCEYKLWTDAKLLGLVIDKFPQIYKVWYKIKGIQRADLGRYAVLYTYGGIYADTDVYALKKFRVLDADRPNICLSIKVFPFSKRGLTNYFIYAPPEHPLFLDLINEGVKRLEMGYTNTPYTTGRVLMNDIVNLNYKNSIEIYKDSDVFNKFCYNCEIDKDAFAVHDGGTSSNNPNWNKGYVNKLIRWECYIRKKLNLELRNSQVPYISIILIFLFAIACIYIYKRIRKISYIFQ